MSDEQAFLGLLLHLLLLWMLLAREVLQLQMWWKWIGGETVCSCEMEICKMELQFLQKVTSGEAGRVRACHVLMAVKTSRC